MTSSLSYLLRVDRHREKTAENDVSDGFGSIFSGAAFCLAKPIGVLLVPIKNDFKLRDLQLTMAVGTTADKI